MSLPCHANGAALVPAADFFNTPDFSGERLLFDTTGKQIGQVGADMRVPMVHGATHRQVGWIEYSEAGHGWALPENRIDFWTRVKKFLDKHIGAAASASAATAVPTPPPSAP